MGFVSKNINVISRAVTFPSWHTAEQISNKFDLTCFYNTNRTPIKLEKIGEYILDKVKRQNQQDATNSMFIIKLLSQHVSSIIMPIIRRIRQCPTACGVLPGCVGCGRLWSCGVAL